MARGKGVANPTSSRGGNLNTTNRLALASQSTPHVSDSHVSRSTSTRGRGGYSNTSNRQPLTPLVPAAHVAQQVPTVPRVPATTRVPVAPCDPAVHVGPRAPATHVPNIAPRVPATHGAAHAPVAHVVPGVAPHVNAAHVAPHIPPAQVIPPVNPPVHDAIEVPHVPLVQNVPQDENPPNNQPRKTRGVTKGVNAPKGGQLKVLVTVLKRTLTPAKATSKIGPIFRRSFNKLKTHWCQWNGEGELDLVWAEYLRYFRFSSPQEQARGRKVWEYIAARNYPKYLYGWKRNAIKAHGSVLAARNHTPKWTSDVVWHGLCDYWMSPLFIASSLKRKQNRSSKKNIPHTSGRVPYEVVDLNLEESLGRPPTQLERFTETHTRKNNTEDNNNEVIWVTEEAEKLQEVYTKDLRDANGLDSSTPINGILHPGCEPVQDPGCKVWAAAVGGVQRGRLYGRPGESWRKRSSNASSIDYDSYADSQSTRHAMKRMKKKMDNQEAYIANMISNMGPVLAELTARCGMAPFAFAPYSNDISYSTPTSDGGSNNPATSSPSSPFDDLDDIGYDFQ